MRTSPTLILALALTLAGSGVALAKTTHTCFNGYGYHMDSGKFAYTEHHDQTRVDGKLTDWTIVYRDPKGKVIARKHMNFSDNPYIPVYTLNILASGYREGIRHDAKGWRMIRRESSGAQTESKAFKPTDAMAADSGFHPFLQAHFKKLMAGKTVDFQFAAAGRQDVINLTAKRIDDTTFEGKKAVRFRAKLDMFLISYFVKPLILTYDPDSKKLLEYRGISNLHNDEGKTYPVRVSYYSKMPAVAKDSNTPMGCSSDPDN